MKVKVKFKAIGERGKNRQITVELDCPDFEIIKQKPFVFSSLHAPINCDISVNSQVITWLDEVYDTRKFMDENDLISVLDYEVVTKKEKIDEAQLIKEVFERVTNSKDPIFYADFLATSIRMKHVLKGMSVGKKVATVLAAQGVGYKAATKALTDLSEYSDSLKEGGKNRHLITGKKPKENKLIDKK